LLLNPLPIGITQVGESEIGAVKKAESIIVIFEVKTVSMARRLLVDEAEGATVGALTKAIKESFGETKPQTIVGILLQLDAMQLTGAVTNLKRQLLLNNEVAVINEISGTDSIDAEQLISWFKSQFLSNGA
tara:strand:- start:233 stop:625 length:393 start_codon:yes stop_codon:yes gene_type:complete